MKQRTLNSQKLEAQSDKENSPIKSGSSNKIKKIQNIQNRLNLNRSHSSDILEIIRFDPILKQLNSQLQVKAQNDKKQKLIQTFPVRYQALITKQLKFQELKIQLKELQQAKLQKQTQLQKDIQTLNDQIAYLREMVSQNQKRNQQSIQKINQIRKQHSQQIQLMQQKYKTSLSIKEEEIKVKEKMILKQKQNLRQIKQVMQQLRLQKLIILAQNQRLVDQNKQLHQTISMNQKNHLQNQSHFKAMAEQFQFQCKKEKQLSQIYKINYQKQIFALSQKIKKLQNSNFQLQTDLKQKQEYIQILQNEKYEEAQSIRLKLLDQMRQKVLLQADLDRLNQEIQLLKENQLIQQRNSINQFQVYKAQILQLNQQILNLKQKFQKQKEKFLQLLANKNIQKNNLEQVLNKNQKQSKLLLLQVQQKLQNQQKSTKKLTTQIEDYLNQLNNEKQKTIKLQCQIQQYKKQKKLQIQRQSYDLLINQLKNQFQSARNVIIGKNQKIQQQRLQMLTLRKTNHNLRLQIQSLQSQLNDSKQLITQFQKNVQQLNLQMKVLLNQKQVKKKDQLNIIENFKAELMQKDQQIQTQILKLQKLLKQIQNIKTTNLKLLIQLEQMKNKNKQQSQQNLLQISILQQKIKELTSQIQLNRKNSQLRYDQSTKHFTSMIQKQVQDYQTQISSLNAQIFHLKTLFNEVQRQQAQAMNQICAENFQIQKVLTNQRKISKSTIQILRQQLTNLGTQNQKHSKEKLQLIQEIENLLNQLKKQKQSRNILQNQIQNLKSSSSKSTNCIINVQVQKISKQYKKIIQKMKVQMMELTLQFKDKSKQQENIIQYLLNENQKLKRESLQTYRN